MTLLPRPTILPPSVPSVAPLPRSASRVRTQNLSFTRSTSSSCSNNRLLAVIAPISDLLALKHLQQRGRVRQVGNLGTYRLGRAADCCRQLAPNQPVSWQPIDLVQSAGASLWSTKPPSVVARGKWAAVSYFFEPRRVRAACISRGRLLHSACLALLVPAATSPCFRFRPPDRAAARAP